MELDLHADQSHMSSMTTPPHIARPKGAAAEVFVAFLRLGLTSFGGPAAHLGYFRNEFVGRRGWLDDQAYADLIALCQFLPGPASSQVGFTIGLHRAGPLGALAAWAGFTLPSALLMTTLALSAPALSQGISPAMASAAIHGLKLAAVAIVAQAVWGMARSLAPDRTRATLALFGLALTTLVPGAMGQIGAILLGASGAILLLRKAAASETSSLMDISLPVSRTAGLVSLGLFALLLLVPPILQPVLHSRNLAVFDAFYRSGALVFGGGHVVLPLLKSQLVDTGWLGTEPFLSGYALAQAIPGPLFTLSAYLGAILKTGPNGVFGAVLALIAIFLPGLLILVAALPFWSRLRGLRWAQHAMKGANAAVVGLLGSVLYNPLWIGSIHSPFDFLVVAAALIGLTRWNCPPLIVVLACLASGLAGL